MKSKYLGPGVSLRSETDFESSWLQQEDEVIWKDAVMDLLDTEWGWGGTGDLDTTACI